METKLKVLIKQGLKADDASNTSEQIEQLREENPLFFLRAIMNLIDSTDPLLPEMMILENILLCTLRAMDVEVP